MAAIGLSSCARDPLLRTSYTQEEWASREALALVSALTLEEKASQVLMVGIDGSESFPPHLAAHFKGRVPGAVLLFKRNISPDAVGIIRFIDSAQCAFRELGGRAPVLFAIDHEGGSVYRTGRATTRLPSAVSVAERFSDAEAEALYRASGAELAALGIGLNLAPVAETLTPANAPFLDDRAYSGDPDRVGAYARAAVRGFRAGSVLVALKHFPGNAGEDPHKGLPVLSVGGAEFARLYVAPFRAALRERADAVLVSHVVVPSVEKDVPFCLSRKGVTGLLRGELGFDGLVVTDDLAMGALSRAGFSPPEAAVRAIEAGCDLVLVTDPGIGRVVRAIAARASSDAGFARRLDEAVTRVLVAKARVALASTALRRYRDSRSPGGRVVPLALDRLSSARKAGERALRSGSGASASE